MNRCVKPDDVVMRQLDSLPDDVSQLGNLQGSIGRYVIWTVNAKGKRQPVLRYHVVWYKNTGSWPVETIDHKDDDKTNDVFTNLQEMSDLDNMAKSKKSGLPRGIRLHKCGKYEVRKWNGIKMAQVGLFSTVAEAVVAWEQSL